MIHSSPSIRGPKSHSGLSQSSTAVHRRLLLESVPASLPASLRCYRPPPLSPSPCVRSRIRSLFGHREASKRRWMTETRSSDELAFCAVQLSSFAFLPRKDESSCWTETTRDKRAPAAARRRPISSPATVSSPSHCGSGCGERQRPGGGRGALGQVCCSSCSSSSSIFQ